MLYCLAPDGSSLKKSASDTALERTHQRIYLICFTEYTSVQMNYTPNIDFCQVFFYNSVFFVRDAAFLHIMNEMTAVISSVTQKAFHTPSGPKARLSRNAAGTIITRYLHRDIMSDGTPFPRPSSAPDEVTETADTTKPALMIRRALSPASIAAGS